MVLMADSARVDAWLWAVRVFKTRSAATAAVRAGHVKVNGDRAKAAQPVKPGDEVRVRISGFDRILEVRETLVKRVGAPVAATAYIDSSPPLPTPDEVALLPHRDRGAGRPTKRERRDIDKLLGRD
jgi:ribosome-associated heat shock protein Hsp15